MIIIFFRGQSYYISRRALFFSIVLGSCAHVLIKQQKKKRLERLRSANIRAGEQDYMDPGKEILLEVNDEFISTDLSTCIHQHGLYEIDHRGLRNLILSKVKTYGKPLVVLISKEIFRLILSVASKEMLVAGGPHFGIAILNWQVNLLTIGTALLPAAIMNFFPVQILLVKILVAATVTYYANQALEPKCSDFTQLLPSYDAQPSKIYDSVSYLDPYDINPSKIKVYVENKGPRHPICMDERTEKLIVPDQPALTLGDIEKTNKNPCNYIPRREVKRGDARLVPLGERTKTFEQFLREQDESRHLNELEVKEKGGLTGMDENLNPTRVSYQGKSRVRLNTGLKSKSSQAAPQSDPAENVESNSNESKE